MERPAIDYVVGGSMFCPFPYTRLHAHANVLDRPAESFTVGPCDGLGRKAGLEKVAQTGFEPASLGGLVWRTTPPSAVGIRIPALIR